MGFTQGIYDIPNEEYHASEGISRSQLMAMRRTPYHYWFDHISGLSAGHVESEAMKLGSALHVMVLEPDKFDAQYYVGKHCDRRTTIGKQSHAQQLEEAGTRILLAPDNYRLLQSMVEGIGKNNDAQAILSVNQQLGKAEQSIYWDDPNTGLLCKCRPDLWHDTVVIDLKTSLNASYREFQSSTYKYGYHIQAGMIQEGIRHVTGITIHDFCFVVVEKEPPFATAVYLLDETALAKGVSEFRTLLRRVKDSMESNNWDGYPTQNLILPVWAHYDG